MRNGCALLLLLLASCGTKAPDPLPTSCDPAKDAGTYLVQYTTVSGNCGDIPEQIAVIGGATSGQGGCTYASRTASDGNCRADFAESCTSNGTTVQIRGYIQAQDADFNTIKGVETATIPGSCAGTYDITWTRQ